MLRTLSVISLITATCIALQESPQRQPQQQDTEETNDEGRTRPAQRAEPYSWHDYLLLAHRIESLPAWPYDRQFSEEEWESFYKAARAFQALNADDLEKALLAYMILVHDDRPTRIAFSRPMLLLRVMFEIPTNAVREWPARVRACGALPYKPRVAVDIRHIAEPIRWDTEPPHFSVQLSDEPIIGSGPPYDPLGEARYFRTHFSFRDLSERAKDVERPTDLWRDK